MESKEKETKLLSEEILPKEERIKPENIVVGSPMDLITGLFLKYHKALLAAEEQVRCYKQLYEQAQKEASERADEILRLLEETQKLKGLLDNGKRT